MPRGRGNRQVGRWPGKHRLTYRQILAWARHHYQRTGLWPSEDSGVVLAAPNERWNRIADALRAGHRGLPGGSSLARLIGRHPGSERRLTRPKLTPDDVLKWSDAYHRRTGRWPTSATERILEAPDETWSGVRTAMIKGLRGWRHPKTLALFLALNRGIPYRVGWIHGRTLTLRQIVQWARAHFRRTGQLPTESTGRIPESPGESWSAIDSALRYKIRGLPEGYTLATLLRRHFKVPMRARKPRLTYRQIIEWAKAHRQRTGEWPTVKSGPLREAPGETWSGLNAVLREGFRGLPGGITLSRLLNNRLGVPIRLNGAHRR